VLIHFKDAAEAKAADEFTSARGIILRPVGAYNLHDCLRLTVGGEEANHAALDALTEFVKSRK